MMHCKHNVKRTVVFIHTSDCNMPAICVSLRITFNDYPQDGITKPFDVYAEFERETIFN
jgi:hypothetical protein